MTANQQEHLLRKEFPRWARKEESSNATGDKGELLVPVGGNPGKVRKHSSTLAPNCSQK